MAFIRKPIDKARALIRVKAGIVEQFNYKVRWWALINSGLQPSVEDAEFLDNRFTGLPGETLETVSHFECLLNTGLKPGVNETAQSHAGNR